ncbi:MAG: hypothetical protein JWQ99_3138, partial [Blastococcus sp.]|nr:hypothetical protein [Blastococcus sp.]
MAFTTALHRAGLPVTPERAAGLARSLQLVLPVDRDALYWACRVTLVTDLAQLPVFDAVFSAVFDGMLDPADARGDPTAPPSIGSEPHTRPSAADQRPGQEGAASAGGTGTSSGGEDDEAERDVLLAAFSAEERLHSTSFADLAADELEAVRSLVRRLVLSTPARHSRRTHPSRRTGDRLDLRRTVRAAQRSGGDPVRLVHARRRTQPRRLVLLCDVSGSMEPFTRVYLTLLQGAVTGARAEAFVFATRLTRLTRQLAVRNTDQALARAGAAA